MFSRIVHNPALHHTPASVNLLTKQLTINPLLMAKYTPQQKAFIIAHEAGHLANNSKSELAADAYALKNAGKYGLTPQQAMQAAITTLNRNSKAHQNRVNNLLKIYNRMNANFVGGYDYTPNQHTANWDWLNKQIDNFRDRRDERREDKQEFKLQKIGARAAGRADVAAAGGGLGGLLDKITGAIGGGMPTGGGYDGSGINPGTPPSNNNTTYIIIGLVVVALVVFGKKFFK
jgi:hypothetical protein